MCSLARPPAGALLGHSEPLHVPHLQVASLGTGVSMVLVPLPHILGLGLCKLPRETLGQPPGLDPQLQPQVTPSPSTELFPARRCLTFRRLDLVITFSRPAPPR